MPNGGHASALIETLVRKPGFEYFNNADGHVYTHPFSTTYDVRYHFVTTPRGYRLEVMHLAKQAGGSGYSPLHAAMWRPDGAPPSGSEPNIYPIVHLSYKVSGAANYQDELDWLDGKQRASCGMRCRSEYGLFSYWLPWSATALVWLKPRANTRDGAR